MPQIEWIEVAVGTYPKVKKGKIVPTKKSLIFVVTKEQAVHYEYFLEYSSSRMDELTKHMFNDKDVTFTIESNIKSRKIRNKVDPDKTKNTPFRLATSFSVT